METPTETVKKPGLAKTLFLETRPQFLILIPCVLAAGVALAYLGGNFNGWHLLLALIGSLLIHASVNAFNDYTDWVRGTDKLVERTPFSGGSGLLKAGALTQNMVLAEAVIMLVVAVAIGAYFSFIYPGLIWIVLGGAALTVLYTPILTKTIITEIFPGVGLGFLPVWGAYFVMQPAGAIHFTPELLWISLPAGLLVSALLWVNELPDVKADTATGRKHAVLLMGTKAAAWGYVTLLVLTYASIVAPVALGVLPVWCLLGLGTIPLAVKAGSGAVKNHDSVPGIIPALGQNVITVLATPVLIAIGLLIARLAG